MSSQRHPSTVSPQKRAQQCRDAIVALLATAPAKSWSLNDVWTKLQSRYNRAEIERALWRLSGDGDIERVRKGTGSLYRAKAVERDGFPVPTRETL